MYTEPFSVPQIVAGGALVKNLDAGGVRWVEWVNQTNYTWALTDQDGKVRLILLPGSACGRNVALRQKTTITNQLIPYQGAGTPTNTNTFLYLALDEKEHPDYLAVWGTAL